MKKTCKNCENCSPSYKGGACRAHRDKKVKYSNPGCAEWRQKK